MKTTHFIPALMFSCTVFPTEIYAADTSKAICHLKEIRLICSNNVRDGQAVLSAMANPKSLQLLIRLKFKPLIYTTRAEREIYRNSLEINRRIISNYADQSLKNLKSNRMSPARYAQVKSEFRAAMDTYWAGMAHYWAKSWHTDSL